MSTFVLFGGPGSERRVSVASAQHVLECRPFGALFWTPEGKVIRVEPRDVLNHTAPFVEDFRVPEAGALAQWPSLEACLAALLESDVLFLALHGGAGEDGTVQRLCEAEGLRYTGSGPQSSARAFDKVLSREVAKEAGCRVAEGRALMPAEPADDWIGAMDALFQGCSRIVLKPSQDGSSFGLHFVERKDPWKPLIWDLHSAQVPYLAEHFVEGRELTVGVIQGPEGLIALPPGEVVCDHGSTFDYEGKYLGRGTEELVPAPIGEEETRAAQSVARKAHRALECAGYSRTDVFLTPDGRIVFIELNTLPGITKASWIPKELAAAGIEFSEFIDNQVELAEKRAS